MVRVINTKDLNGSYDDLYDKEIDGVCYEGVDQTPKSHFKISEIEVGTYPEQPKKYTHGRNLLNKGINS